MTFQEQRDLIFKNNAEWVYFQIQIKNLQFPQKVVFMIETLKRELSLKVVRSLSLLKSSLILIEDSRISQPFFCIMLCYFDF